jgi:hypothetical protein
VRFSVFIYFEFFFVDCVCVCGGQVPCIIVLRQWWTMVLGTISKSRTLDMDLEVQVVGRMLQKVITIQQQQKKG